MQWCTQRGWIVVHGQLCNYQNFSDGHILVTSFFLARRWCSTHACALHMPMGGTPLHLIDNSADASRLQEWGFIFFKFFLSTVNTRNAITELIKVLQNVKNKLFLCHNSNSGWTKLTAAPGRMGVAPGSDVITWPPYNKHSILTSILHNKGLKVSWKHLLKDGAHYCYCAHFLRMRR